MMVPDERVIEKRFHFRFYCMTMRSKRHKTYKELQDKLTSGKLSEQVRMSEEERRKAELAWAKDTLNKRTNIRNVRSDADTDN